MRTVDAPAERPRAGATGVAGPDRMSVVRLVVGYAAVVAVLPYLTLKALWVSGTMVGVPEGSPARGSGFVGLNLVTGLLDVVAILVALAFTHRWGRRLPAWLVLAPIWVGTGLLIPAVVELVNGAAAAAVTGGRAVSLADGLVEPWTYVVVYTSFGLQGLLLTTAFALYARARWADLLDPAGSPSSPGPTRGVQVVLAAAGAVAAGAVAAAHLVMAFGTQGAVTGADQPGWEYTARSGEVVNAAMAGLAVAGIRIMIRRPDAGRRTPVWVAVAFTWTGSGAMFAYALLTLAAVVTGAPESDNVTALNGLTQLAALLGGLLIAVTALVNLAERPPRGRPRRAGQPVTRKPPPGAATRPDRVRPGWFGYAATAVTGGLALAACRWTVTGSGYPFGPSDPRDAMSLLRGLPPDLGAPLFAGVLAVTAVAMLAMTASGGGRRWGGARVGLLMVGWTAAAVLLVVVPDLRLLALTAYAPMLLVGAPSGWPDIDYGTILTASMAYQGTSLLGGLLVAATVLVWQRRTRGACAGCGRTDARTPARWRPAAVGRWATGVAVAVPLLFAVTRYAWMVGVPLGIGEGALGHLQETDGRWRGGGLASFAVIGAVLTLGLARPWGEVVPHWLPGLGGRRLPVAVVVVPATFVALLVMSAGLGMMSNVGVFFDELGAQGWLVAIHALWPLWSLALGVAASAYYLRRRGRCTACGRH